MTSEKSVKSCVPLRAPVTLRLMGAVFRISGCATRAHREPDFEMAYGAMMKQVQAQRSADDGAKKQCLDGTTAEAQCSADEHCIVATASSAIRPRLQQLTSAMFYPAAVAV